MLLLEVKNSQTEKTTLFAKLQDVYPECLYLIRGEPKLFPLLCLRSNCPRNMNCMERLAKRVHFIFEKFEKAELLLLYFRYSDMPEKQRAGVFWRDMSEPRLITMNPHGWEKMKEIGVVYEWTLPEDLFLKA